MGRTSQKIEEDGRGRPHLKGGGGGGGDVVLPYNWLFLTIILSLRHASLCHLTSSLGI